MEVSLVDEVSALGVPEDALELVKRIVDSSEEIVVASDDETIIIRGRSGRRVEIPGRRIGTHTIYRDKNVVIVAWLERFTYKYLVIAGGWDECRDDSGGD